MQSSDVVFTQNHSYSDTFDRKIGRDGLQSGKILGRVGLLVNFPAVSVG